MRHSSSVIETDQIGKDVTIQEFCVVRKGVVLGDRVKIHPHVVIESGVVIGNDVEVFPGAYIGKEPKKIPGMYREIQFESKIVIGDRCSIGPNAVIYYDVQIGCDTLVGDQASIREQCRVGSRCIISRQVSLSYHVSVGDGTRIMDLSHLTGNMRVGKNVFVSMHVSSANDNAMGSKGYGEENILGPVVEDDAKLGAGVILLPGVVVGKGAMVGAGSVVTKPVAPGILAMGVPARFVRRLA